MKPLSSQVVAGTVFPRSLNGTPLAMELITTILVFYTAHFFVTSLPINNGFTLKFSPGSAKDDTLTKQFGALFAKIPQDKPQGEGREAMLNAFVPYAAELGTGCTNQIAKIIFPTRISEKDYTDSQAWDNNVNLPIFRQPFSNYKILVATAPPNIKLSGEDTQHMVIYLVFPDDDSDNATINLPAIYFVNKLDASLDVNKKKAMDPIFIIDSNRTVTGLKSKEVAKHVRFTNPLSRRYNYHLT